MHVGAKARKSAALNPCSSMFGEKSERAPKQGRGETARVSGQKSITQHSVVSAQLQVLATITSVGYMCLDNIARLSLLPFFFSSSPTCCPIGGVAALWSASRVRKEFVVPGARHL